jgi:hypothetical protein
MGPIVNGIKKEYAGCMQVELVNFHERSTWHDLLDPLGSPEFDLLDSTKSVIYRWFGVVEKEEFSAVLDPLCG